MARRGSSFLQGSVPSFSDDFETTTDINDCRVWEWGSCSIENPDHFEHGTNIASYIEFVSQSPRTVYFHNLAFDATFILDYIMKNGWKYVKENPKDGEFTTLISNAGKFYTVTLIANGNRIEFRDSFKKIPLSVSQIAKTYKLEEQKLEIDYDAYRPIGYTPTEDEINYLRNDVTIVAKAMRALLMVGMKKLTAGADALSDYKKMAGRSFKRTFPILSKTVDDEIRKAYRGGFTYINPDRAGKLLGPGRVYDVNSLYPYVMNSKPIPYGYPDMCEGAPDTDEEFIASITFTASLKPHGIPCIQIKRSPHFAPTHYQTEIKEPVTLSVTSVDLRLWQDNYDLDIISWNGSFIFKTATDLFTDFISKWSEVKERSEGGERFLAKRQMNSLYGKFATNTNVTGKYPVLRDGHVALVTGPHEERDPVYTPAGVFITAWARDTTIRAIMANRERFIYGDTDSMHLLDWEEPREVLVHDTRLGAWKLETEFTKGVFVRAKQYSEVDLQGVTHTHIAGLPLSVARNVRCEDLLLDREWHGKLVPVRVSGGTILRDTSFTFKAKDR